MKKMGLLMAMMALASSTALSLPRPTDRFETSPYDVVAPSFNGTPTGDHLQGQIYYDASPSTGGFRGINKFGGIDILSVSGGNAVISSGIEKVERITVPICTTSSCSYSASGSWVSAVNRTSTGNYSISIGGFSAAPTCVVTSSYPWNQLGIGSSSIIVDTFDSAGTSQDTAFTMICMGPQ